MKTLDVTEKEEKGLGFVEGLGVCSLGLVPVLRWMRLVWVVIVLFHTNGRASNGEAVKREGKQSAVVGKEG